MQRLSDPCRSKRTFHARDRAADAWIGQRLLLEFLILTVARTNEARGAR